MFYYLEDRERRLETAMDKMPLAFGTFSDEVEREKARQRTYDAMRRKAEARHVTGGRVFGYENVPITESGADGRARRIRVERRVVEAEAVIVRLIFQRCADGWGKTRIAKALNAEGAPSPRAQQGRPNGWSASSIHELLYRELYRKVIVWNRTRKRDSWGQKRMTARTTGEWLRVDAPELRIVSDDLWQAAHARLEAAPAFYLRGTNGQLWGRPREGESKYLLTSLVRCASCGSGLCVRSRQHGRSRAFFYSCQGYHKRGQTVCANHLEIRMVDLDAAVLELVADEVLDPSVIDDAIGQALAILAPERTNDDLDRHRREFARVEAELLRLSEAIARGGDLTPLVEAVQARQGRREALQGEIRALEAPRSTSVNPEVVAARLRGLAREWRTVLGRQVVQGRQVLRQVLDGPLQVTPDLERRRVRLEGAANLSKLLEKVTGLPTSMASPTGTPAGWRIQLARELAA